MPHKDPEKRREANREAQRRYRARRGFRLRQPLYLDEAIRVLGLERTKSGRIPALRDIDHAYKRMIATVHPDRAPGTDGGRLVALATLAMETIRFWKRNSNA